MTVAYLGPEGTFTETAARLVTGGAEPLEPCNDISAVLRKVEAGTVERGVVPIENTLEGSVRATVDALAFDTDLLIEAELELPITLVLAVAPGVGLDEVVTVHSHPVALAQCRRWLSFNLPDAQLLPATSTARAAQVIAEMIADTRAGGEPGDGPLVDVAGPMAAVVNPLAVERYGLEVVARGISDAAANTTRFVVVGHTLPAATGWDKTSLVVFIPENRPGALLSLLEIFAKRDLNLSRLESRPTRAEMGEYCFLVDVEGHLADERVGDALAAAKRTLRDVKVLGSYRRSGARRPEEAGRIAADDQAHRDAAAWLAQWRARVS